MVDLDTTAPVYILAGGQSKRLGRDKARVMVSGQELICRLVEQVAASRRLVHLVADKLDRYADLGLGCLIDAQHDAGPLAGLITAMEHRERTSGAGWLLLLSCDIVRWDDRWAEALMSHAQRDCSAVAFSRKHVFELSPEPMPALYHSRTLQLARDGLESGSRSLKSLIQRAGWSDAGPSPATEWSFNTEDELETALENLRRST
ncbi:MAG: hypothetical protein Aurels2KO_19470 [Aureliella sp.]